MFLSRELIVLVFLGVGCKSINPDNQRMRGQIERQSSRSVDQADTPSPVTIDTPPPMSPISMPPAVPSEPRAPSFEEYQPNMSLPYVPRLSRPMPWQVFQRRSLKDGEVQFEFIADILPARFVRARLLSNGQAIQADWALYQTDLGIKAPQAFNLTAPAGGWYTLEVLVYDAERKLIARQVVDRVGVGEVFLVSGQSNSTNCGSPAQQSLSGMVASTNGVEWRQGHDPQIGTADGYLAFCSLGSNWPRTGDRLAAQYKVPIAFASTGHSGTEVAHWLPNASNPHVSRGAPQILYNHLRNRALQLGKSGFRAVLWHQGENDTVTSPPTTSQQYYDRMRTIMNQVASDLGKPDVKWLVAQASWCKDGTYPSVNNGIWGESAAVRDGQMRLWQLPHVYPGPDTDQLKDDIYRRLVNTTRDCHFSGLGLQTVGDMWFERIVTFLNEVMPQ